MQVTIITVGKIKEAYIRRGIDNYTAKLKQKVSVSLIEVADERAPENLSEALIEQVKTKEGVGILKYITSDMYVVSLEILGKEFTTTELTAQLRKLENQGKNHFCFVIGGSLGLSDSVSKRSNLKLSFSKMTLPHQLMRMILMEQLVNVFK